MNYRIEAFELLLNENCLMNRYYPLLPYRQILIENLKKINCPTKEDCVALPDETLLGIGLPSLELVALFRRFLILYDVSDSKLKEIDLLAANETEAAVFRELYLLPGVKAIRARLYYDAGYRSLGAIASALPEEIIRDTAALINRKGLTLKVPLLKEVRTQIAVAKVLTAFTIS